MSATPTERKKSIPYLMIGKVRVPMSDAEAAALEERLTAYVDLNGVPHGFVRVLLGGSDV